MVLILEAGVVRKVVATPEKMVEQDGAINFGTFRTPFVNANILDAPLYFPSSKFLLSGRTFASRNGSILALSCPPIILAWLSLMPNLWVFLFSMLMTA